jgi:hypothetical protein
MVFTVLFFIPVLLILLLGVLFRPDPPPRRFNRGQTVTIQQHPTRRAIVRRFWLPDDAAAEFPEGVTGVGGVVGPPYPHGVIEVDFLGRNSAGAPFAPLVVSGDSVQ